MSVGSISRRLLVPALLLLPGAATAMPAPHLVASVGRTAAVADEPNDGGFSMGLAFLWPFERGLEFGVQGFADDLGTNTVRLVDPNDPAIPLGEVAEDHRWTYGMAWRFDTVFRPEATWAPYASASWGYYRIQDDRLGTTDGATSATGVGLGVGVRRTLAGANALGLSVRYHRLTDPRMDHYLSAAADWRWHWGRKTADTRGQ